MKCKNFGIQFFFFCDNEIKRIAKLVCSCSFLDLGMLIVGVMLHVHGRACKRKEFWSRVGCGWRSCMLVLGVCIY